MLSSGLSSSSWSASSQSAAKSWPSSMTMASKRTSGRASIAGTRLAARPSNQSWPGLAGFGPRSPARSASVSASRWNVDTCGRRATGSPSPSNSRSTDVASAWLKHTYSVRQPSRASRRAFSTATRLLPLPAGPTTSTRRWHLREVEDLLLGGRCADQALAAVVDVVADEAAQLDGRREEVVDDRELGGRQRVRAAAVGDPPVADPPERRAGWPRPSRTRRRRRRGRAWRPARGACGPSAGWRGRRRERPRRARFGARGRTASPAGPRSCA